MKNPRCVTPAGVPTPGEQQAVIAACAEMYGVDPSQVLFVPKDILNPDDAMTRYYDKALADSPRLHVAGSDGNLLLTMMYL